MMSSWLIVLCVGLLADATALPALRASTSVTWSHPIGYEKPFLVLVATDSPGTTTAGHESNLVPAITVSVELKRQLNIT